MLYWTEYNITEQMLNEHNIIPLSFYEMSLIEGETIVENFKVQKKRIYGYFKKQKDELYCFPGITYEKQFWYR
jgi:hypothetical protein